MEKERPMDRLLCGDVGFGKTEVAMRVAFKAVTDNKQVAVLVPTTLLAEQHYDNFVSRFANFPVNIEVVSRFKSAKERNILHALQNRVAVKLANPPYFLSTQQIQFFHAQPHHSTLSQLAHYYCHLSSPCQFHY